MSTTYNVGNRRNKLTNYENYVHNFTVYRLRVKINTRV